MSLEKEVENINKTEIEKIYEREACKWIHLDKCKKYYFTIDMFEVFFRLYIDKDIQVFIRTNTLNSKEKINYEFVKFEDIEIDDIEEYKKNIKLFYENIIKEVVNTTYCPEHHHEMIPQNSTQEEIDDGWATIYERRLLTKLNYKKMDEFKEWLNKVSDETYIWEQKSI